MSGTIAVARWTPERVTLVATRETWEGVVRQESTIGWRVVADIKAALQRSQAAVVSVQVEPSIATKIQAIG